MNRGLRDELVRINQRELRRELDLAAPFLKTLESQDPDTISVALAAHLGVPVTLLDRSGRIVGASSDLSFQHHGMMMPLEHGELQAALAGEVGFAQRRGSGQVEIRLFAAAPIVLGGQDLILQLAVPLDEIKRAVRTRSWRTVGLALPALLLAGILTLLLGNSFRRPIQALDRRARSVSAGHFSRRISAGIWNRELRELAGAFNRMTDELALRFRSLESERDEMQALIDCMGEAVIGLTEDARVLRANKAAIDLLDFPLPLKRVPIGTLVRQPALRTLLEDSVATPFSPREVNLGERHLIVSSRAVEGGGTVVTFVDVTEIRRVEIVRRDFVANASHELKTPLTAMRGFAETLLDDDVPEDLRKDWLESIRSHTLRLQHLVDDLLDLSRLESGGWVARGEEVELAAQVNRVLSDVSGLAQEKEITLSSTGNGFAQADRQGLEQIIKNLVDNAIRYTPSGGRVTVTMETEGGTGKVTVTDTGPGIPTSALSRIFERFYRVDPARSRAEGGTGLGLAIVRHLVNAMGGEVWAESELGQGTSVIFTLPAVTLPAGKVTAGEGEVGAGSGQAGGGKE